MDKYSIILVDDEREIIEGIIQKVDFESLGFVVVGAAENGEEAYQLSLKLKPDIVMSDIIMPFMDGLSLGEKLKEELPNTKLILFSGHDDLEFAHRAIKMNVVEYVLKPVNAQEIGKILSNVKQQLDQEYEARRDYEFLKLQYQNMIPILRDQFLAGLLEGKLNEDEVLEQAPLANFDLKANGYCVVLFEIAKTSQSEVSQMIFKEKNSLMMNAAMKQLAEDILSKYVHAHVFFYHTQIASIVQLYEESDVVNLSNIVNEVCMAASRIYEINLSAGISNIVKHRYAMCYAKNEAISALDYRLVLGDGKAIAYEDISQDSTISLSFQEQDSKTLSSAIRLGSPQEIKETIATIFAQLYRNKMALDRYHVFVMELMLSLLKMLEQYQIDGTLIFAKNFDPYHPLTNMNSLVEFEKEVVRICVEISRSIQEQRSYASKAVVTSVMEYIEENFANPSLNVETISRAFHISASYLSRIFKKETDESLIGYLTNLRLEEATKLLLTTNEKSYAVAQQVGYSDPNYFSYVFKKKYGIAPTRYRKIIEEKNH